MNPLASHFFSTTDQYLVSEKKIRETEKLCVKILVYFFQVRYKHLIPISQQTASSK